MRGTSEDLALVVVEREEKSDVVSKGSRDDIPVGDVDGIRSVIAHSIAVARGG